MKAEIWNAIIFFSTRMLVRCDADGKLYLYDLVRTKKETSKPPEQ